jgi:hypothetical protein
MFLKDLVQPARDIRLMQRGKKVNTVETLIEKRDRFTKDDILVFCKWCTYGGQFLGESQLHGRATRDTCHFIHHSSDRPTSWQITIRSHRRLILRFSSSEIEKNWSSVRGLQIDKSCKSG